MAKKWLKIVYTEKNPAKLKLHYKSWAKEYDKDLTDWGYAYPKRLKAVSYTHLTLPTNREV